MTKVSLLIRSYCVMLLNSLINVDFDCKLKIERILFDLERIYKQESSLESAIFISKKMLDFILTSIGI